MPVETFRVAILRMVILTYLLYVYLEVLIKQLCI